MLRTRTLLKFHFISRMSNVVLQMFPPRHVWRLTKWRCENTNLTASPVLPSLRHSSCLWNASFAKSSTCPLPSEPSSLTHSIWQRLKWRYGSRIAERKQSVYKKLNWKKCGWLPSRWCLLSWALTWRACIHIYRPWLDARLCYNHRSSARSMVCTLHIFRLERWVISRDSICCPVYTLFILVTIGMDEKKKHAICTSRARNEKGDF